MGGGGAHRAKAEVVCAMEPRVGGPGGEGREQQRRGGRGGGAEKKDSGVEGGTEGVSAAAVGSGREM